jgi:hypothetical protein
MALGSEGHAWGENTNPRAFSSILSRNPTSLQSTGATSLETEHSRMVGNWSVDTTERVSSSSESEQESESEDSKGLPLVSLQACQYSKLSGSVFNGSGESGGGDTLGCSMLSSCFVMSIRIV